MKRVKVAIVLHMHQPFYENPMTGEIELPWVRLHAVKDYWRIIDHFARFGVKVNVTLTPSLAVQIYDYSFDRDSWWKLTLKDPDKLTPAERGFILNVLTKMVPKWAAQKFSRLRSVLESDVVEDDDVRDVQFLFNLAWFYPGEIEADPTLKNLMDRGRAYTSEDFEVIRKATAKYMKRVLEFYKEDVVECVGVPYAHPILPLLIDLSEAKISDPTNSVNLPEFKRLRDAEKHIDKAFEIYADLGLEVKGFWSPECAVSNDSLRLLAGKGIEYTITDESLLYKTWYGSPQAPAKAVNLTHRPYKHSSGITLFFRNKVISDTWSFVYSQLSGKDAASDFFRKLEEQLMFAEGEEILVVVALDGENCWEHFEDEGREFLDEMLGILASSKEFVSVWLSEVKDFNIEQLPRIEPGSWVWANFNVWAGHTEDALAWRYLAKVRDMVTEPNEYILRAEASDWFWWYGEDFFTLNADTFDRLFRDNLKAALLKENREVFELLDKPIKR